MLLRVMYSDIDFKRYEVQKGENIITGLGTLEGGYYVKFGKAMDKFETGILFTLDPEEKWHIIRIEVNRQLAVNVTKTDRYMKKPTNLSINDKMIQYPLFTENPEIDSLDQEILRIQGVVGIGILTEKYLFKEPADLIVYTKLPEYK